MAGNVRRTAEIAFGDAESEEYIDLKNYDKNPERAGFGWASNNSIMAKLGMDYVEVTKSTAFCRPLVRRFDLPDVPINVKIVKSLGPCDRGFDRTIWHHWLARRRSRECCLGL